MPSRWSGGIENLVLVYRPSQRIAAYLPSQDAAEIAIDLGREGNRLDGRGRGAHTGALVVGEEKEPILFDGSTEGAAELILFEGALVWSGGSKNPRASRAELRKNSNTVP